MRGLRFLLSLLALPLLLCRVPNRPPEVAWLRGVTAVVPGTSYSFVIVAVDPDGDSLRCELTWGDDAPVESTAWHASLDTLVFQHTWSDTGDYQVEFRLVDARGAAAPAGRFALVRCRPAILPQPPEVDSVWGPARGFIGVRYWFGARAYDANGDRLRYQFEWGDGEVSDWSPWMRPGTALRRSHTWTATGEFSVRARCEDRTGLVSEWEAVTSAAMVSPPELRWEIPLDEPVVAVPLVVAAGEVVVADREQVARYARSDGSWLDEHVGPVEVLALAGRAGDGVFVRDRDGFWGFIDGRRWQVPVEGLPLMPVVVAGRVFVPIRDTCLALAAGSGGREGSMTAPALNWISPAVDNAGRLVCLGDSLRRYRLDGTPDGVWSAPELVPEEFIAGPGRLYGCGRLDANRTLLQAFDTAGTHWYRLLGGIPSPQSPLSPVAGSDGRVYFACRDSVSAFSASGSRLWSWQPDDGAVSSGTPCLGSAGDLFVGITRLSGGALVALDSLGRERWRLTLECKAVMGMVIAADSVIYGIGADNPALFAAWVGQGPAAGWPTYRHDAGLSGSAAP